MFVINQQVCSKCGGCASVCPELAIIIHEQSSLIIEKCTNCGTCALFCPLSAIAPGEQPAGVGGQEP